MISQEEESQSNNTTPRGSLEFLPPPPPHLLHSDEECEEVKRGLSVAESVKELQRRQAQPSPGTLRRVQSMSAAAGPGHTERHQIMARLDAALASPRPSGPRPASPSVRPGQPQQDQIYAPVAALQQKIQQQQQARLQQAGHCVDPGLVPHPPGPVPVLSHQSSFSTPVKNRPNNTEGEEYGFGMQFQVQSNNFYQHQHHQHPPQQQHRPPQQQQQYGVRGGGGHYPNHHHPQHDQIMSEMDPTLSHRPQPPGWQNGVDPASAIKVRHWIETRTVSDVRKVRPVLNQQIQQGFQLRKAVGVKDRSQPRF